MTREEQYKATLAKYLPLEAVDDVFVFLTQTNQVKMRITPRRNSKLGDYRWPQPEHPYHEISVNGNLNPYLFLWVLLHEMAHLNTHKLYGTRVQPHGHEWQQEYARLLANYQFPPDIEKLKQHYIRRIPLKRQLMLDIEAQLHHYDPDYKQEDYLMVKNLEPGTRFCIKGQNDRIFKLEERVRTRFKCLDEADGRRYLITGSALVEEI